MLLLCVFSPHPPSSIWVMKIMSSVFLSHAFQLQCFLCVAVSVCWTVSISLKPSIGVYMWQYVVIQECISWFLRLLLLLVSISLSFMLILCSPYTQKLLLCGHWPGILIFLSGSFPELIVMQIVPKLCPDFGRVFFHNAPHILEASLVLITPTVAGHFPYILSYTRRSTSLWNLSWIPQPRSSSPFPEAQAAAGPPLLGSLVWPPWCPSQATLPSALRLPVLHFYG